MRKILELKGRNGAEWYIPAVCVEAVVVYANVVTIYTTGGQEFEGVAEPTVEEILATMAEWSSSRR
jgi:hypothetical protein